MDLMSRINSSLSIEEYLAARGYHLVRHGNRHLRLKEHDSFIIDTQNGRWYWNSQGQSGRIVDLVMCMEGVSQAEAIKRLARQLSTSKKYVQKTSALPQMKEKEKPVFALPPKADKNWKKIYAYLLIARKIDLRVVKWLANNGLIYPDDFGNLVYISKDADGKPIYAAAKGTNTLKKFIGVVPGSDYIMRASWNLNASNKAWFVCEAAVDVWSLMSLLLQKGIDWRNYGFISCECSWPEPLIHYLETTTPPAKIYLAQDADEAGMKSRAIAREMLSKANYLGIVQDKFPAAGKDWNDYLRIMREEWNIVLEDQALHIELSGARVTVNLIDRLLNGAYHALQNHMYGTKTGEQMLSVLNRQGRALEKLDIDADATEVLKKAKRQLKKYAVDFAFTQDKENGKISVWFKGQDVERIQEALKDCIKELGKDNQKEGVEEICQRAEDQAASLNAACVTVPPERGERI